MRSKKRKESKEARSYLFVLLPQKIRLRRISSSPAAQGHSGWNMVVLLTAVRNSPCSCPFSVSLHPPQAALNSEPQRGRLLVQYKHGVQCRTPSRSDRFNGVTGVARGPKGRNRNLPWPPGKKDYKVAYSSLFNSLSLAYGSTPPSTGRLWGAFYQLFPCNSALPRRYAGKLLPSSHFHDIFES